MFKRFNRIRIRYITQSILLAAFVFGVTGGKDLMARTTPSLSGGTGWLNTQPLQLKELRGKVVLVEFWTYTCINWRRALPYTRAWASKYKDHGLIVIGVHTPEFVFEHKRENVSKATRDMNIDYPVVLDNNYEIWRSFDNQAWPALYLLDARGKLRYQKFGEGDYVESEMQIQKLIKEASGSNFSNASVVLQPHGMEMGADWKNLQSPENFLGFDRTEGFASPGGGVRGKRRLYSIPRQLNLNQWALSGEWSMGQESVRLSNGQGKVIYRFHARDLHLIMGSTLPGTSIKFRVLIDGKPPGPFHGLDVHSNGEGVVTEPRMYQLIRQQGPIINREFQIEFLNPDVEVYDFTFG